MKLNEFTESMTCSECGGPAFTDLILAEKKDACYSKVRSRYKVWPSAYASGALVQCRKKGASNWGNSKNEGVAEGMYAGTDDTVGFGVNSEAAYQAVMARFGDQVDHDETSGIMYVPERMWPQVEMVAFDADGEGATQVDGLDEGSYDRDDYYNARQGREYGKGLTATGYGGNGSATRRDDIFKGQSKRLPADPFARTSGAVPTAGTGKIHNIALPGEMDEGEKIGGRHDADDFDDMVLRLKKLAGAGPMKTVYDPDRRVYRNMPTAQQPAKQPKK